MAGPSTPIPLHVLLLEDTPDDAALLERELEAAGYAVRAVVVDNRAAFLAHLRPEVDVILSDHALPPFNALQALDLVNETGLDVPFIIVSGIIDEVTAVEAMRHGAADYLLKDRLARLGPAVRQALRAKALRAEKERAFTVIRESEARYRLLAEHATDVICRIAPDGTVLYASPSCKALLGYEAEELIGRNAFAFVHPEEVADLHSGLSAIQEQPFRARIAFRAQRRDGSSVWIEAHSKRVLGEESGDLREIVAVLRDVTERKQFERELIEAKEAAEASDRLKSAILSNLSHEIRTPLTAILGHADLLVDSTPEEVAESAALITRGGQRLLDTLNALLDLAQLEANRQEVPLHPVDLRDPVRRAAERFAPLAASRGLTLDLACSETPVVVAGDGDALERVVAMLVENALKFTQEGGATVTVQPSEGWGEVAVVDTGVGIGEAFFPHLFDAFKQESEGETRQFEGSGLGLTLVSRLVGQMGGTVAVESEKGTGTTFLVRLPSYSDFGSGASRDDVRSAGFTASLR